MAQRKYTPRRPGAELESDPTVRLTISVKKSDEEKIKAKAEALGYTISRLLSESALADQSLTAMTIDQVITRQGANIGKLNNECDVWVFGGSGPKFPFVEGKEKTLADIWVDRSAQGIHHHILWDLDLAEPEGMREFITGTVRVARTIKEKAHKGRIIHHGVTIGELYPASADAYRALRRQIAKEDLGSILEINDPLDIGEAAKSPEPQKKAIAREARWLCRFGEMGSLVAVLPRGLGLVPTACLLHDALLLHPDGRELDLWLWLQHKEAEKLALHAKEFLELTQP
jgi:hypothetical protein